MKGGGGCPKRHAQNVCAAAELIASNEYLLTEILIRLPAKPLFKFKTVSKFWLYLISTPHLSMHWKPKPASGFILKEWYDNKYFFISTNTRIPVGPTFKPPMTSLLRDRKVVLLHASNGLVLCRSHSTYFVCNPLTSRITILPMPPRHLHYGSVFLVADFAFKNNVRYFKIISVNTYLKDSSREATVEVYSSEKGLWSLCPHIYNDEHFDILFARGVVWNSKVCWPSNTSHVSTYFDAGEECFRSMPMPPLDKENKSTQGDIQIFGESNGRLHLVVGACTRYGPKNLVVFEMKMDCSEWFKKHVLSYPRLPYNDMDMIGFVRGEIEKDSAVVLLCRYSYQQNSKIGGVRTRAVLLKDNGYETKLQWHILSQVNKHVLRHEQGFVQQCIENPFWDEVLDNKFWIRNDVFAFC